MAKVSYAQRIRLRIKELEEKLSELRVELDELRIADKVLGRLGEDQEESSATEKPESGGLTIADNILTVLGALFQASAPQIHKALDEQFRPGVSPSSVAATLSRMRAKNIVDNYEGKWFIVTGTQPPAVEPFKPSPFGPGVLIPANELSFDEEGKIR